jgi:hypothetical protein
MHAIGRSEMNAHDELRDVPTSPVTFVDLSSHTNLEHWTLNFATVVKRSGTPLSKETLEDTTVD